MKIAVVTSTVTGQIDALLSEAAGKLEAEGLRLSGAVKVTEHSEAGDHHCDMDLRILPSGPEIRITQSLGEGASGCRLDPAGIVAAVAAVEKNDLAAIDMFVLNKFGPQETEGRGFCDAIAGALEHDIPVLVGVGKNCQTAFDTFVGGMAEHLPPESDAIYDWCKAALLKS